MINFASPHDTQGISSALKRIEAGDFDWVVATTVAVVDVLVSQRVKIPSTTRVAAVGESTGTALTSAGYQVEFVPAMDNSPRGLLREWPASARNGRVLVLQSELSEPNVLAELEGVGLGVEFVVAYRTVGVPVSDAVAADVASGRIRAVLVSSGTVARQVQEQLGPLPEETIVACIGPRTAFDARAAGLTVKVIAEDRTVDSLVEGLAIYAKQFS
ncbi:MAG: uroporphyrinogen-III synthase [Homoserinimonas sp.]|nr:uroporphyrinogen-III synthase [Homoserinimonas sp.]